MSILVNCYGRGYLGFSVNDFISSGFSSNQFDGLVLLAEQEIGHATIINTTIQTLGGQPTHPCDYTFGLIPDVLSFVSLGQNLVSAGVEAYTGLLTGITNSEVQQIAASIAPIEVSQTSWLNSVLFIQPFNSSGYDLPLSASTISGMIKGFLGSNCISPIIPTIRSDDVAGVRNQLTNTYFTDPRSELNISSSSTGFENSANNKSSLSSLSTFMMLIVIIASLMLML